MPTTASPCCSPAPKTCSPPCSTTASSPCAGRIGYAQPLRPFSLEDTRNYIRFHLQRADADLKLFSDPAIKHIFQATKGKPRIINQLCLYLLIQAAIAGIDTIDGDFAAAQIAAHPFFQARQET